MADKNLRLQILLEALDKVTAPLKKITGASANARKDLAKTQDQLKALDALQQQIGRYKAKETAFAGDNAKLAETRERLDQLRKQLEATEKPTKKLRTEFERAETQAAQLTQKLDRGGAELQDLSRKLSAAGIDVAELAKHEDRLAHKVADANQALRRQTAQLEKIDKARRNSDKLNEVSQKATGAGLGMVGAGMATALPVIGAVKEAMTFEQAMADVRKVVDFPTPRAFEEMSQDVLELSTRIPVAADGIAQIVAAAGRANVPRKELLRFTEDAAKMGVAFEMQADAAGETMAKWRTAFELPQDGVVALADQINALTNTYGGNVGAVTDMVTRIGPLGKVGGMAAAEIAAMGQVLSSVGVESEIGATGIKNMMLALTKGEAATKSQTTAFAALGLNAVQVSKDMQRDAGGAILDVMARLQKLPKETQAGLLTQLFGSESVAAIAPMLTSLDQLRTNFAMVGDAGKYAGSMNREYLAAVATTSGATGLASNALQSLNITAGQALLPTVVELAKMVTKVTTAVTGWARENPAVAKMLMIFAAAGAAALIVLGGLLLIFAGLAAAAAPLGIGIGALVAIIGGVVAAIAALAVIGYLIYDNWDAIVGFFSAVWARIKKAFDGGIWGVLELLFELNNLIADALKVAFDYVIGALPSIGSGLWEAIKWLFWNGFMLLPRLLHQFAQNSITGLIERFAQVIPMLKTVGLNIVQGIWNGILGAKDWLMGKLAWFANLIPEPIRRALDINSPSRVFAAIGGHVMSGLDQGLAAGTSAPITRIGDLSDQMTRALRVGAVGSAMALAAPAAAQGLDQRPAAAAPPRLAQTFNITINTSSGDAKDIAEEVRKAIEQLDRERRGRGFGDD